MKAIIKGHKYELKNFESKDKAVQIIAFIKKEPKIGEGAKLGEMVTVQEGTTNEEVISMLIDRIKFLQTIMTCRENAHVIVLLEKAKGWLESRTADRKKRKVEGTHKA